MKSLQDYTNTYRDIMSGLGVQGELKEILSQILGNASYISEVDHIVYTQEASLEKCTLSNSKIQHCMNEMYSVYRGQCPRVILRFKPNKYLSLNVFDELVVSNSFKIYYLGFWKDGKTEITRGAESVALLDGFEYGPAVFPPALTDDDSYIVVGLLAGSKVTENYTTTETNNYYVESIQENLSNDLWVKINNSYVPTTRQFSDHILNASVFDLTIPSFGSRLYLADVLRTGDWTRENFQLTSGLSVEACWYVYSSLSDYNQAELKKIAIKSGEPVSFSPDWLLSRGVEELAKGVVVVKESDRDSLQSIHYRANRDRYVNSIIRSNSDVGIVLEEMYPNKVKTSGTSFEYIASDDSGKINIYYVPVNQNNLLTPAEIDEFKKSRSAYYITDQLNIQRGSYYSAVFNIDLELYQSTNVDSEIASILSQYEEKFNINLETSLEEIRSLISKISNVKQVKDLSIIYISNDGTQELDTDRIYSSLSSTYFKISYVINSTVQTKS